MALNSQWPEPEGINGGRGGGAGWGEEEATSHTIHSHKARDPSKPNLPNTSFSWVKNSVIKITCLCTV
jgi:hypothetical protein